MEWEPTNEWNYNERLNDLNYRNWRGSNEWGKSRTPTINKGSFEKGEDPNPVGRALMADPGG